jgi:type II secretory pathway component PulC
MTLNLTDSKSIEAENKTKAVETEFEYKIIGFIAGDEDSSVVVKKGNKEQVVVKGAKLDGKYTLMSVSRDEIIFQTDTEVFKIKNEVGR